MKSIKLMLFFIALNFSLSAQPTAITWQGKLLDNRGNAITQNNVAMTFAMFDASTGGNQLWPASGVVTKTVDVVNGLYSVQLGTGTGDDIAFTAAMFDGHTPWLEVKVGTETLPRTEITTVPFALISNDLSAAAWETPGEIGKTTPNTGKFTSLETGSLKVTTGASNGKVLTSDADGNASWTTPYTGLTNFTESNFTYDSRTGVKFTPNNTATDVDLVLQPKGTGAIIAQQPDGATTGGNIRGQKAVDLQMQRTAASQVASGQYATAIGNANTASQLSSTAIGSQNTASNGGSTAIGWLNTASGLISTAMGYYSFATGEHSTAIGWANTASGKKSFASGYNNAAQSFGETVLGIYATIGAGDPSALIPTDRLFVIGNGNPISSRSDAFTILKNANTTIGGSLTLNGNGTNASFTFPTDRGTSGQVLTTDGNGLALWEKSSVWDVADEFSATASQTVFTLTQIPAAKSMVRLFINGVRISKTAFTCSGTTFTYNPANNGNYNLSAGDRIQIDYFY